jgi:hypothetical protein
LREQILDFDAITARIGTPVLLHCKAGADGADWSRRST